MYIWLSTDPLGGDSDFASIPSITGTKPDVFSVFADFRGRLSLSISSGNDYRNIAIEINNFIVDFQ